MLGTAGLRAETVLHANCPMPEVGGLWTSVLQSGVTLLAILAETLTAGIIGQGEIPLLTPFCLEKLI